MPIIDLANEVRKLPIDEILKNLGFEGEKQGKSTMFKSDLHAINVTGEKWYDHRHGRGGAGAIDLAMHLNQSDFRSACVWLSDRYGKGASTPLLFPEAQQRKTPKPTPDRELSFPEQLEVFCIRDDSRWQTVRTYLTEIRRLPEALVDSLHKEGRVFASHPANSKMVNVSLPLYSNSGEVTGMFTRSTIQKAGWRQVLGSKLFSTFSIGDDLNTAKKVVLVESPIDALSYHSLRGEKGVAVVAVNGNHVPPNLAEKIVKAGQTPVLALDFDTAGVQGISRAKEVFKEVGYNQNVAVESPIGKDWNEDLITARPLNRQEILSKQLLSTGIIKSRNQGEATVYFRGIQQADSPAKLIKAEDKTFEEQRQIDGEKYVNFLREQREKQKATASESTRLPISEPAKSFQKGFKL